MNATLVPSGDHAGSKSLAGSVVSLCSPDPFAFTGQMSSVLFENVIRPERAERSMEPELRVGPGDPARIRPGDDGCWTGLLEHAARMSAAAAARRSIGVALKHIGPSLLSPS